MEISPEIENAINSHLASGNYADANELLGKALEMVEAAEKEQQLQWLRAKIEKSLASGFVSMTLEETLADFRLRKAKLDSETRSNQEPRRPE